MGRRIPLATGPASVALRVVPRQPQATDPDAVPEPCAQAVWLGLEDLWLRFAALGWLSVEMSVEQGTASVFVIVHDLRNVGAGELRSFALDAETYQSRAGGRIRAFVRTIAFRGDDLVCELTPAPVIARWPDGEGLALQVRAFVARMTAMPRGGNREGNSQGNTP
jgi:hypothetical protein